MDFASKMEFDKTEKKNRLFETMLVISCFMTNISQLPYFVSSGRTQLLNTPVWIVTFFFLMIIGKYRLSIKLSGIFALSIMAACFMALLSIFTEYDYFHSSVISCLLISLFILLIGEQAGRLISEECIRRINLSYVVSTLIVSLFIYVQYFSNGYNLSSRLYAYSSKNSISQIIFTAIVILLFTNITNSKFLKICRIVVIAFEVFLLMILRSRATIVGFFLCLFVIVVGKEFNRKLKYLLMTVLCIVALLTLFSQSFFGVLFNNILFAGRKASDLNNLTSGRVHILSSFPDRINGHWLTGIGSIYYECFPLSCILQFGLIAGIMIIIVSYSPLYFCVRLNRKEPDSSAFVLVCVGYIINSLFEGLAPIGPGVKCYYLWLMFGILISKGRFKSRTQ